MERRLKVKAGISALLMLARIATIQTKLSSSEQGFMEAALDEAGGGITPGTKINFDSTEKRAVTGLEKKGLLLVQDGEVEVTALGASWFRKASRARFVA